MAHFSNYAHSDIKLVINYKKSRCVWAEVWLEGVNAPHNKRKVT